MVPSPSPPSYLGPNQAPEQGATLSPHQGADTDEQAGNPKGEGPGPEGSSSEGNQCACESALALTTEDP